jgi:hypothetical protein
MMFPDTSNAQQSAALRQAAERSRAVSSPQSDYSPTTWKPMPAMRNGFSVGAVFGQARYAPAHDALRYASR